MDFGGCVFAFGYGTASGILTEGTSWDIKGRYYGTQGSIIATNLNDRPFDYPGRDVAESAEGAEQWLLPHVTEAHRPLAEQHVFEDIMQLADWVRLGLASPVTAEHARHVIDIIESAYRAASTGMTQELRTTMTGLHP